MHTLKWTDKDRSILKESAEIIINWSIKFEIKKERKKEKKADYSRYIQTEVDR